MMFNSEMGQEQQESMSRKAAIEKERAGRLVISIPGSQAISWWNFLELNFHPAFWKCCVTYFLDSEFFVRCNLVLGWVGIRQKPCFLVFWRNNSSVGSRFSVFEHDKLRHQKSQKSSLFLGVSRWCRWRICQDPALFVRLSALRHFPGLSAGLFRPPMTIIDDPSSARLRAETTCFGAPNEKNGVTQTVSESFEDPNFRAPKCSCGALEWTFVQKGVWPRRFRRRRGWIEGYRRSEINHIHLVAWFQVGEFLKFIQVSPISLYIIYILPDPHDIILYPLEYTIESPSNQTLRSKFVTFWTRSQKLHHWSTPQHPAPVILVVKSKSSVLET